MHQCDNPCHHTATQRQMSAALPIARGFLGQAGQYRSEDQQATHCVSCDQDAEVCPLPGMALPAECSGYKLVPQPAENRVRCHCDSKFYGYSLAPGIDRVAELLDYQRLTEMRCDR